MEIGPVHNFFGVLFDGLAYGFLLFLISVGLSITLGLMGFINLAHGVFATAGGYLVVTVGAQAGIDFLTALPIVFGAVALASLLLERLLYRPLYKNTALNQVLLTVCILFIAIVGALLTQTTQFAGIGVFSFQHSADLLIMLIIGGTATLYDGFVGAAAFLLAQDYLAGLNSQYWLFWLGILLIVSTLFVRGGILGGLALLPRLLARWRHRRHR